MATNDKEIIIHAFIMVGIILFGKVVLTGQTVTDGRTDQSDEGVYAIRIKKRRQIVTQRVAIERAADLTLPVVIVLRVGMPLIPRKSMAFLLKYSLSGVW